MTTSNASATAGSVSHERYELMQGDCCELLTKVASGSVHCILADPPYGIAYESKAMAMLANDQQPYVWWLSHASRVLADEGVLVCFCRWDVGEAFRQAIAWSGLQMAGQLVWDRMLHGQGDTSRTPAPQHDIAWVATKGKWTFPSTRGRSVVRAMKERGGFGECANGLLHPTMKPIALMEELVLTYSAPGQTVLDPTMGSGSTGVAAVKHGRKFVGIELDDTYFAVARARIARAAEERSMFAGRGRVATRHRRMPSSCRCSRTCRRGMLRWKRSRHRKGQRMTEVHGVKQFKTPTVLTLRTTPTAARHVCVVTRLRDHRYCAIILEPVIGPVWEAIADARAPEVVLTLTGSEEHELLASVRDAAMQSGWAVDMLGDVRNRDVCAEVMTRVGSFGLRQIARAIDACMRRGANTKGGRRW